MDLIFSTPFLIRILISFLVIVIVNHFTKKLLLSISLATLLLALWIGHSPHSFFTIAIATTTKLDTILLALIIFQIVWLSHQMSETKTMKQLVDVTRQIVPHRASFAVLPAITGLLPMPGGALFSAPMLNDCDPHNKVDPLLKTSINYWFRHIWEYWWPLYPGVLLAIEISKIGFLQFTLLQFLIGTSATFAGALFFLNKIPRDPHEPIHKQKIPLKEIFFPVAPILIIIFFYAIFKLIFTIAAPFLSNKFLPVFLSIPIAIVFLQRFKPLSFSQWKKIILSLKTLALVMIVIVIRLYGAVIESELPGGGSLMSSVTIELSQWGISPLLLLIAIPFLSGITTGIAVGFVGASFPIVLGICGNTPWLDHSGSVILAYASGYVGMLLSPVHLCLIVTNEYFKTHLFQSIKKFLAPAAIVWGVAMIVFLIFYLI